MDVCLEGQTNMDSCLSPDGNPAINTLYAFLRDLKTWSMKCTKISFQIERKIPSFNVKTQEDDTYKNWFW